MEENLTKRELFKKAFSLKQLKKYGVIVIGTILYSAGIGLFLDPNAIAPGGVVGLSVILSHTLGGTTGTIYFLLNIPILIVGWWKLGSKLIGYSFFAIFLNSTFTNLFATFPQITDNLLLAVIAGSLLVGTGLGLVLRTGATTGGIDIIIKLIRRKYKGLKTSTAFIMIDMAIVTLSGIVFRNFDIAMYSLMAVLINGRVMDYLLYGNDEAGMVYIVSDRPQNLLRRILQELEIGATILQGKGAYSNQEKDILLCVVKKRGIAKLQELVKEEDARAFMIVTSANEIFGEGYKNIKIDRV